MAPKRKRDDIAQPAVEVTTRTTRASQRAKKVAVEHGSETAAVASGTTKSSRKKSAKRAANEDAVDDDDNYVERSPTKKKTKATSTTSKPTTGKSSKPTKKIADQCVEFSHSWADDAGPSKVSSKPVVRTSIQANETGQIKNAPVSKPTAAAPAPSKSPPQSKMHDVFTASRANTLFKTYADPDDPAVIGPDGLTRLCADAQMPMDGALPLVLAWQLQAKEMGKFTKKEWDDGMSSLQISSLPQLSTAMTDLENLLILGRQPVKRPSTSQLKNEPYNRTMYWTYVANRKGTFSKFYAYCFALAKPEQARNIDMETATAFWSVLLEPQHSIMKEIIEFINEKGTYKGVNKDLWNMMYEFCQTVKPNLEDYEADGAWPTLLDDFALWKKSKMNEGQNSAPGVTDD